MKAKRKLIYNETRPLERLRLTAIAIFVVVAAVLIKAALLGEFNRMFGSKKTETRLSAKTVNFERGGNQR